MIVDFLYEFFDKIFSFLLEISPYLIIGFLFSGILSVLLTVETVTKYLGSKKSYSVFLASLFGVPLPLCSCGVIPVFSYLKKHGASKGAATSFLISTPQTGVDSIMVTYSLLGPVFAIYRPIIAFISGIIGGSAVSIIDNKENIKENMEHCDDDCCDEEGSIFYRIFNYGFVKLPQDIGSVLIIGIIAAAFIALLIPENYFMNIGGGITGMIIMLFIGLPSYICATASVPIALALHLKGFSMGALIVFLMTGPATNIATISVAAKQIGKKATIIYISTIIVCSITAGLLFDAVFPNLTVEDSMTSMMMIPYNIELISAIVLLVILGNVFRLNYFSKSKSDINNSNADINSSLIITGMTCNHCVDSVTKTLNKLDGVTIKNINLNSGRIDFINNEADINEIHKNIKELGYEVKHD